MENKFVLLIVAIVSIVAIIGSCIKDDSQSPEQKKYNQYEKTLSSYMDELSSSSANKTASIKRKINDFIRKYKAWKAHSGISESETMDDMIKNYNRVNISNERTIYIGGN